MKKRIRKTKRIKRIKRMKLWIQTRKGRIASRKQQQEEVKIESRRKRREYIENNLPNIVLIGTFFAIIVIVLVTMVAILVISCIQVKDFAEKAVESTLLASGLSIIGIAIAVWTGLNIMNAIEKKEVDEINNNLREARKNINDLSEIASKMGDQLEKDKWNIENIIKDRNELYIGTFKQELINTNYDIISRYFYKKFSNESFNDLSDFPQLIMIEQYFEQVFRQYGEKLPENSIVRDKAYEGIRLTKELMKKREGISHSSREKDIIDLYLEYKLYEFHFLLGYMLKEVELYDAFKTAAEGFIRISSRFGVKIPDYEKKNKKVDSISYNGTSENLNVAVYFLNTIGEAYSKISAEKSLIGQHDKANVKITEEDMITYSNKAIFYLRLTMKWNEKLEEKEVYYRNLGCAYERADRISNKFGAHASAIINNYKEAFINVISNKEVKMSRVQNVYHTLLSYYERYMKFTFFIGVIGKDLHENIELFEKFLRGENIGIDISVKEYLFEYQRISEIAITDNARFSLQRVLCGLSWTWIVVLLLKNDEFIAMEYPNSLTSYLIKIKEQIDISEIMGITDDNYFKELKKRYDMICEYLQEHEGN